MLTNAIIYDNYYCLHKEIKNIYGFKEFKESFNKFTELQKNVMEYLILLVNNENTNLDVKWNKIKDLANSIYYFYLEKFIKNLHPDENLIFLFYKILNDLNSNFLEEDSMHKIKNKNLKNLQIIWASRYYKILKLFTSI